MEKDYSKLSKEELLKVVEKLESRKKYGLIWDEERTKEQFEKESENALPVLKEVKAKAINNDPSKPVNILIEGDNYHALSVLNYTHQGKIDVIYIDPPYNTGNKDFKYNDQWVNKDDVYRHSKWLSFMIKRLRLAKGLLKDDGAIFVSIDNIEFAQLKLLCDSIFGEDNFVGCIVWKKKTGSGTKIAQMFDEHEYVLAYAKNIHLTRTWRMIDEAHGSFKNPDSDPRGSWESCAITAPSKNRNPNQLYCIEVHSKKPHSLIKKQKNLKGKIIGVFDYLEHTVVFWSGDNLTNGTVVDDKNKCIRFIRRWAYVPKTMETIFKDKRVYLNGKNIPRYKKFESEYVGKAIPSIYFSEFSTQEGSNDLKEILPDTPFDYPKPKKMIKHLIQCVSHEKAVILDFFAGTGTTGQAILELSKDKNDKRSFILCTNDEGGICSEVCYPRIKIVISGYKNQNNILVNGTSGNLKYFKTSFVKRTISKDSLKVRITRECTEMLCLREGVFDEVKKTDDYRIFQHNDRIMGVYYSLERAELQSLKKDLDKMKGKKILYCFTLDPLGLDKKDFRDWKGVSLEPIPQKILDIYEGIYEY